MKRKTLAIVLALTMLLSLGLTACGGSGDDGGSKSTGGGKTLIIHDSAWEGVDLFQVSSWNDMQCLLADPVLEKDPETKAPIPGIASESVWSDDGLTWTLTFPEGMYYSTGEQLEPEDFIASVEYGKQVSEYASGYSNIESMEVDGRNVICHLSEFQADMEYNFESCFVGIIDKDELDSMSKDEKLWGVHPYGAYYLDQYEPGAYAILKANPGYVTHNPMLKNKGVSPIETVKVVYSGEDFTLAQGVKNGDYDVLDTVPASYYEELASADGITVVEAYGAEVNYAELNITDPLFNDIKIREAIVRAVNRDNMASYLDMMAKPAYSLILEKCLNYDAGVVDWYKDRYGYDPEVSKQLLADAGWTDTDGDGFVDKDGKKFTFEFDSRDTEQSKKIAQSLQADLKAVGIDMTIKTQNWSYVNQDVNDGNFQMAYLGLGWSEPFLLVDMFCQRNPEATNPDLAGHQALVAEARKIVDYDERTAKITEIQEKLLNYCSIIPLADNTGYRCWRSEIQGIVTTPTGGFYLGDIVTDDEGNFRNVQ